MKNMLDGHNGDKLLTDLSRLWKQEDMVSFPTSKNDKSDTLIA